MLCIFDVQVCALCYGTGDWNTVHREYTKSLMEGVLKNPTKYLYRQLNPLIHTSECTHILLPHEFFMLQHNISFSLFVLYISPFTTFAEWTTLNWNEV